MLACSSGEYLPSPKEKNTLILKKTDLLHPDLGAFLIFTVQMAQWIERLPLENDVDYGFIPFRVEPITLNL